MLNMWADKGNPGSHWRIVGLASAVNANGIQAAADWLREKGLDVSLGSHLFDRNDEALALAGSDLDRARDLTEALWDPSVDVVLAARGGYGAMRLLPHVDWARLARVAPKPVVGFSDITAVHHALARIGWPSLHGPNAHSRWDGTTGRALLAWFRDQTIMVGDGPLESLTAVPDRPLTAPWHGGNLALVSALVGTPYQPHWAGSVLYLEDVHEKPYRIDRMLQQLKLAGILSQVQGVVFGEAVFDGPPKTDEVRHLVRSVANEVGIPAWWGLRSGHSEPMLPVPFGVSLTIGRDGVVRMSDE